MIWQHRLKRYSNVTLNSIPRNISSKNEGEIHALLSKAKTLIIQDQQYAIDTEGSP
jgi:hypothetical protein